MRVQSSKLTGPMLNFELETGVMLWLNLHSPRSGRSVGYPSGQRGQTVNLLAYAFDGSNPSPTTSLRSERCGERRLSRRNEVKADRKESL